MHWKSSDRSMTASLIRLRWLSINIRIKYKTVSFTHKLVHSNSPSYLTAFLKPHVPVRSLRSAQLNALEVRICRTVDGSFAFTHHAPSVWNSIPLSVREPISGSFHCALKTHLFLEVFPAG